MSIGLEEKKKVHVMLGALTRFSDNELEAWGLSFLVGGVTPNSVSSGIVGLRGPQFSTS